MKRDRRRVLVWLTYGLVAAAGSARLLGRSVRSRPRVRFRAPDDLAPIPWIGHC